jgi:lipoyl(octanoyl) transferase
MWSVYINRHSPEHPFRFSDLIKLQDEVLESLRPVRGSAILFAELPPTLTLGARQIHLGDERTAYLKTLPIEIVAGERGGNETWHGPGQWVGFVLTPLLEFAGHERGVRVAVMKMLKLVEPVAKLYLPEASIEDGARLGIWSAQGKVASIGIKIRDGYTSSGFAINCVPNPAAFLGIDPCGIASARPGFLFRDSISPENLEKEFLKIPRLIQESFEKNA